MNIRILFLSLSLFANLLCLADETGTNDYRDLKTIFLSGNSYGNVNDKLSVLTLDLQSLELKTFWKATMEGNWFITRVWTDPLGEHIALCIRKFGTCEGVLVLLNNEAIEMMRQTQFGLECAFSPDGKQIAYTRANVDAKGRRDVTGTWIYDIATGTQKKVSEGGERLCWAAFDGNLYILQEVLGQKVVRYVPKQNSIEETNHKDVVFSGDGRYYYAPTRGEGIEFCLYRSETDDSVMNEQGPLFCYNWEVGSYHWFAGQWILIEGVSPGNIKWYLYNPYTKIMKMLPGPVLEIFDEENIILYNTTTNQLARTSVDSLSAVTLDALRNDSKIQPKFRENLPSEMMEAFKNELPKNAESVKLQE